MLWKTIATTAFWVISSYAQQPPQPTVVKPAPLLHLDTDRALREALKSYRVQILEPPVVCSIPLREVPVSKDVEPMPKFRPPAEAIDRMPSVLLPAPPCQEEKR